MKISIAMATYNGAKYIQEQLDSFIKQTHQPHELVVADDGSTDNTLQIIENFAQRAPFKVTVLRNEKNLGYGQNFSKVMELCNGDLVFLSDQDDIWFKEKIDLITEVAKNNPEIMLFMNDAELCFGDGKPTGLTKLGQTLSLGLGEKGFTTGCCMAVRRKFLPLVLPLPADEMAHDTWLNQISMMLNNRMIVPQVLQYYRRHGENTSCWIASRTVKQGKFDLIYEYFDKDPRPYLLKRLSTIELIQQRLIAAKNFDELLSLKKISRAIFNIKELQRVIDCRLHILLKHRSTRWYFATIFYFAGNYSYFSGWKSWMKDVLIK